MSQASIQPSPFALQAMQGQAQISPLAQQSIPQNQVQNVGDTLRLSGLSHESASNAVYGAPYQVLPPPVSESGSSLLAQVSGGGRNSTQTILLVTLAVNAAMLAAFAAVMLQELSLRVSQPREEIRDNSAEWKKAQKSFVDSVATAYDQKEAAKQDVPQTAGYNAQREMLLSQLLKRKTQTDQGPLLDAAQWLVERINKTRRLGAPKVTERNLTREHIRNAFAHINHAELDPTRPENIKEYTDHFRDGTIAKIFANPELSKAFQLAARGASNEEIDKDDEIVNKRACKTHVAEFTKFFDGIVVR